MWGGLCAGGLHGVRRVIRNGQQKFVAQWEIYVVDARGQTETRKRVVDLGPARESEAAAEFDVFRSWRRLTKNKVPLDDLPFWGKCGNAQPPEGYTEHLAHGNSILAWLCGNVVQYCKRTQALMIPDPEGRPQAHMFRLFETCGAENSGGWEWIRLVGKDGSDGVGRAADCVDLTAMEDDDDIMVDRREECANGMRQEAGEAGAVPCEARNDKGPEVVRGGGEADVRASTMLAAEERAKLKIRFDQAVRQIALGLRHVHISGPAGYGKSRFVKVHVLREIAKEVERSGVAVTAMTRISSMKLGGRTFQSWGGVGFGDAPVETLVRRMNAAAKDRVRQTKVLIIDEVSLLNGQLLDRVAAVVRKVRGDNEVFGGIRLIIVGDFCQLEPFSIYTAEDSESGTQGWTVRSVVGKYVFESDVWKRGNFKCYRLLRCHRCEEGSPLWTLLNKCRSVEKMGAELFELFSKRMKEGGTAPDPGIDVTYVVNTNKAAKDLCNYYLEKVDAPKSQYWAVDRVRQRTGVKPVAVRLGEQTPTGPAMSVKGKDGKYHDLMTRCRGQQVVSLKQGAVVVAVGPVGSQVPTGSFGVVEGFEAVRRHMLEKGKDEGLFKEQKISDAEAKGDWEHVGGKEGETPMWPRVVFQVHGAKKSAVVEPRMMVLRDFNGNYLGSRYQLPIALGYAVTVHRVQGLDLKTVVYDVTAAFAYGQVYSGCSRASELEKLYIIGTLDSEYPMQHKDVLKFMANEEWIGIDNVVEDDVAWEGNTDETTDSDAEESFNWFQ
eukprot:jgi/Botrbrau1/14974/Bobra.0018s0074.1